MKTNQNFGLSFILLIVIQLIISNYFDFSIYIVFTILPAIVLCLPLKIGTILSMAIAFVTGLAVDFLSDGLPGLNAVALVPVAWSRRSIIKLIVSKDIFVREEEISFSQNGYGRMSLATLVVLSIFLAVYIIADGAGTRPLWFNTARFAASLACSFILSFIVVGIVRPAHNR